MKVGDQVYSGIGYPPLEPMPFMPTSIYFKGHRLWIETAGPQGSLTGLLPRRFEASIIRLTGGTHER
jgi:hypothetical protein